MRSYDAIVVGAGPAGSVTALRLAREGASVLLLDRAKFPRDKPCGGGLTYRAIRELPVDVTPVVEDVVDRFEFSFRYKLRFERQSAATIILMTQRKRLDALPRRAGRGRRAPSSAKERRSPLSPRTAPSPSRARRFEPASWSGRTGSTAITTRSLGLEQGYRYGVALEGNVPYARTSKARFRGRAVLELGVVPGGYGWVFAKGDHVNVGVGGWESEGPRLRDAPRAAVRRARDLARARSSRLRGYRLPLRRREDALVQGRVMLVGDAAGLVDPLSGDGMYEAFVSARLAAGAVRCRRPCEAYAERLNAALASNAAASWAAKRALDRFPRTIYGFARIPVVWRFADALLRGELESPSDAARHHEGAPQGRKGPR